MSTPHEEVREHLIEAQNHLRDIEKKPFYDVPHVVDEAGGCLDDALSVMRCADEDGEAWYTWRVRGDGRRRGDAASARPVVPTPTSTSSPSTSCNKTPRTSSRGPENHGEPRTTPTRRAGFSAT